MSSSYVRKVNENDYPYNICRVCLRKSKDMKLISAKVDGETRSISEALNFVINFDIAVGTDLPNKLCNDCVTTLYKADAFKHRCLRSEQLLCQDFEYKDNRQYIESFLKNSKVTDTIKYYESSTPTAKQVTDTIKYYESPTVNQKAETYNQDVSPKTEPEIDYVDLSFVCDDSPSDVKCEILSLPMEPISTTRMPKKSVMGNNKTMAKMKTTVSKKILKKRSEKKFQCEVCLKLFLTLSALKQHAITHTAEDKSRICPFCGKSFKQGLSQHIRRHQGHKPYKCEVCGKSFFLPSELRKHRYRFHTKEKPFVCSECGESFSSTSNMYAHQRRRHTFERRHPCVLCPKRFYESNDLTKHMLTHTGVKPYPCAHCGRAFARKHHLTTHLKQHRDKIRPQSDIKSDKI